MYYLHTLPAENPIPITLSYDHLENVLKKTDSKENIVIKRKRSEEIITTTTTTKKHKVSIVSKRKFEEIFPQKEPQKKIDDITTMFNANNSLSVLEEAVAQQSLLEKQIQKVIDEQEDMKKMLGEESENVCRMEKGCISCHS